ncbi:hypothetical protein ACJMK2_014938 [Sinanodonta woodiana]|uniref:Uncharacterized protein n=1 Tax=Sinanodonta woodiana TaxID=1069815 RepID=A0ABD3V4X9_SINWO
MKCIILIATLVGLSYQMSTTHAPVHHTRSTHEPTVHQSYTFSYDHVTHKMVVHKERDCYIFMLTDQEKLDVHTDAGLTALEVKFLQLIGTGTKTAAVKSSLEHSIVQACGSLIQHYYTVA